MNAIFTLIRKSAHHWSVEFIENPPLLFGVAKQGGDFSKQHQILQNFRAFGADFDSIYTVIMQLNDVFGLLRAAGENF